MFKNVQYDNLILSSSSMNKKSLHTVLRSKEPGQPWTPSIELPARERKTKE